MPTFPPSGDTNLGPIRGSSPKLSPTFINSSTLNPLWHSADRSLRPVPSTTSPRQVSLLLPGVTYHLCTLCNVHVLVQMTWKRIPSCNLVEMHQGQSLLWLWVLIHWEHPDISPSNSIHLALFVYFHHTGKHTVKNASEECCIITYETRKHERTVLTVHREEWENWMVFQLVKDWNKNEGSKPLFLSTEDRTESNEHKLLQNVQLSRIIKNLKRLSGKLVLMPLRIL